MKIICIADTHKEYLNLKIPKCDILIHAGDIDVYRYKEEIEHFNKWLGKQPCKYKIVIAGNHDGYIESNTLLIQSYLTNAIYLENSQANINNLKIWGSPITPRFGSWSFMGNTAEEMKSYWNMIPKDIDILVTHGPPSGILDTVYFPTEEHVGCYWLYKKVCEIKPKLHIFGHIHGEYGLRDIDGTIFINASVVNESYDLANEPIVVEI